MEPPKKHVMIVAGEASGDLHGAELVKALKAKDPQITFSGLGGQRMRQQGVALDEDLTRLAVVGFTEVLKHYPLFKKIFHQFIKKKKKRQPAAVILIHYPGFNLRLAKALHQQNIKIIYYIRS